MSMLSVNIDSDLWDELIRIVKLYAHARSCRKIGNAAEASSFEKKADELAIKWCRKQRPTGI